MKIIRWIAAAALTLISLMDIGTALSDGESVLVRVAAPLLGVIGLVACTACCAGVPGVRPPHWQPVPPTS